MKRHLPFALVMIFCLSGCVTHRGQELTLAHEINVPKQWRAGNFSQEHPGYSENNSTIERYVNAYERGWSEAVQTFANNINFDDPSPLMTNGWPEESYGGQAGYAAGRDRIRELIRIYGKQKVFQYLQQFKLPEEK